MGPLLRKIFILIKVYKTVLNVVKRKCKSFQYRKARRRHLPRSAVGFKRHFNLCIALVFLIGFERILLAVKHDIKAGFLFAVNVEL